MNEKLSKALNIALFIVSIFMLFMVVALYNTINEEVPTPCDHITSRDISIEEGRVVLKIEGADTTGIKGSGSMRPVFYGDSDLLYITPESDEDICEGDIIVYISKVNRSTVHRVVNIKEDDDGIYYVAKGDHNINADTMKIRFDDIKWVVVGIFY